MNRALRLALLAALGLSALVGCGKTPPPVQTAPASRRFLKTSTEQPKEDPVPSTEKPSPQ